MSQNPKNLEPMTISPVRKKQNRDTSQRPLVKLSLDLINTYKFINQKYYDSLNEDTSQQISNEIYCDDEDGNYIPCKGEEINQRYIVEQSLGSGSFGVVVKAFDIISKTNIAIKLVKNKEAFYKQAQIEVSILKKLHESKSNYNIGKFLKFLNFLVQMTEYFDWKNHLCIVFELLYINLYELLKHTNFQGVSINLTRKFGIQILQSLAYLKSLDIIHCDLKPENILLKSSKQSIIKIIDFGSSCSLNNKMYSYIQSRFYRSPEVIMGLNYDCAIDMWSLGTILVELHTGIPIFDGRNEMDQLHKIVRVLGIPPKWMIENMPISKRRDYFIFDTSIGNYKLKNVTEMKNISLLDVLTRKDSSTSKFVQNETEKEFLLFVDVIKSMLIYEPQKRVKPNEALNHEFFKNCK